jgi:hypothetical protein
MSERDRVRQAIQASVDHADALLEGLQESDLETRLRVVVDGWGRGIAAALEELAIALEDLRTRQDEPTRVPPAEPRTGEVEVDAEESRDLSEARDRIAAQRKEAEQAREDLG